MNTNAVVRVVYARVSTLTYILQKDNIDEHLGPFLCSKTDYWRHEEGNTPAFEETTAAAQEDDAHEDGNTSSDGNWSVRARKAAGTPSPSKKGKSRARARAVTDEEEEDETGEGSDESDERDAAEDDEEENADWSARDDFDAALGDDDLSDEDGNADRIEDENAGASEGGEDRSRPLLHADVRAMLRKSRTWRHQKTTAGERAEIFGIRFGPPSRTQQRIPPSTPHPISRATSPHIDFPTTPANFTGPRARTPEAMIAGPSGHRHESPIETADQSEGEEGRIGAKDVNMKSASASPPSAVVPAPAREPLFLPAVTPSPPSYNVSMRGGSPSNAASSPIDWDEFPSSPRAFQDLGAYIFIPDPFINTNWCYIFRCR